MSEHADNQGVPTDEERARALLDQLSGVHAVDVARDMALGLVNFSSTKLGLSDETRPVRDLDDVRLSIELLRAVVAVLDAEGAGGATHDLHDALAQLQLAYAHAVQLANAERAAEAAKARAAEARVRQTGAAGARRAAGRWSWTCRRALGDQEARREEEDRAAEEADRRELSGRRQTPERAQKRASSSSSPGSTTMNSSSCGPLTSFSRKRSEPVRCSTGRS